MMKPPFERAIVVTLDEARTLLDAIHMRRGVIQELIKASVANSRFTAAASEISQRSRRDCTRSRITWKPRSPTGTRR